MAGLLAFLPTTSFSLVRKALLTSAKGVQGQRSQEGKDEIEMILAITIKRSRHAVRRTVCEFDMWMLVDIFATTIALVGMAAIAVLAMHVFN